MTERMLGLTFGILFQQCEAIHLRHIDVRENHVEFFVLVQPLKRLNPIVSKDERVFATPNAAPHALQHERLKVWLVVNEEDFAWSIRHAQLPF